MSLTEVFRTEWPRVVATLVRDLGDLDLAEDAAQEAFTAAAAAWTSDSWPTRPGAWLVTTARRKAIDHLRRTSRFDTRLPELHRLAESRDVHSDADTSPRLVDDQLALILGCCHPALPTDGQVALTLRIVAGLSTAQIARAFLVSEATMTRRLTRAKNKIKVANIPFEVDPDRLRDRLEPVCGVIYSVFTEGHTSATDATLVRGDLCEEAIWLAGLVAELVPDDPEVLGLLALLLLSDARRSTRLAPDGSPVLLEDQDRDRWDREEISRGLATLAGAFSMGSAGPYQLQAAISALHSTAPSFDKTNWDRIIALYDVLLTRFDDAIVALNRGAAIGHRDGPSAGLAELDAMTPAQHRVLAQYPYLHTCRAEFLLASGDPTGAASAFESAIQLTTNEAERRHLHRRLLEIYEP